MTRRTNRRAWALLITGGLVAALAACGDKDAASADSAAGAGSGSGSGSGSGGGGTPTMKVTVDVTGAVTAKGTSTALAGTHHGISYTSCGQYAKGDGEKSFVLPETLKQPVNGKQVLVGVTVEDYTGPAGYASDKLTDQGTPAGLSFDGKLYFMNSKSKATVTVAGDGAGKWEFTNLAVQNHNNTETSGQLSGSVTWTCKNG